MSEPHKAPPDGTRQRLRRRDVAHLTPTNVRVGSTGVFAGSWSFNDDGRYPVGYVGVLERRWSGWAVFTCSRDVAAAIVTDYARDRDARHDTYIAAGHTDDRAIDILSAETASLWWDGDTIVHDERGITGDPDAIYRCLPDIGGNYIIGDGWTWETVPPRSCDRIIGVIPPRGRQQRWLPLRHSDLRIPDNRLTVTDLTAYDDDAGVVTVATLTLDGADMAVLRVDPDGSHGWLRPPNVVTGRQLDVFVTGCRRHGHAVTEPDVLGALVTEAHTDAFLTAARHAGATAVRLCDADGRTLDLQPVPAGADITGLRAAVAVRSDPYLDAAGASWAVWSGRTWDRFYDLPADSTETSTPTS